jgi:hypothetical protein
MIQQPGVEIDAEQLLNELEDTVQFPGIVSIPLNIIKKEFKQEFPEITGGAGSLDWEGDGSYFQVGFTFLDERTASLIAIFCGYELLKSPQAMKRLEKVAASLGCRIYDPQQT